ncbi:DNA-3-methyladenine glycosylase [Methanophagales archaeon]|nr:MAG: DNA-3-methyladenine glycosylase [Methanophagales archaeon]
MVWSMNKYQNIKILQRAFYSRPTVLVAIDMLGKILFHKTSKGILSGKIVEVEAYLGEIDPACHAFRGKTPRTKIFWDKPGIAYIFINYGIHCCLNAITEELNVAGCVLIRALEPIDGIEVMKKNRGVDDLLALTNGPGKLTQALNITLNQNGADLTKSDLTILDNDEEDFCVVVTSRIGISKAKREPLRFYMFGNQFISPPNNKVITFFKGLPTEVKKAFYDGTIKINLKNRTLSKQLLLSFFLQG